MANFNYYLEKRKDKNGEFLTENIPIIYSFSFEGYRMKSNFGERVDLKHWDNVKQKVTGGKNKLDINDRLKAFQSKVEKIYREGKILDKNVTPAYIKALLTTVKSKPKTIGQYFEEFKDFKKITISKITLKSYQTTSKQLEKYIARKREEITFDKIDINFYNGFVDFLITEKKLTNNSIHKSTKILKAFLNWSKEQGYHQNDSFRKFSYHENETEIFVLDWTELMHLYNFEIEKEYLRQVRDVFCFGCFTGLRYSDIFNLKKTEINKDLINIRVIKTKELLQIPLNKYSKAILDKYAAEPGEKCLPVISNQKMNDYLKILGELVGLNASVTRVRYRGTERIEETMPKHEILSTHMARKTFITNAFRLNIPVEIIMKISGHKDHKVFRKYNKIAQEQVRNEMLKFNQLN